MATTTKFSRQRESIKEYLSSTKEHPTADTIYTNIRKVYPNISLGTVYRNLTFLLDQGEIIKLTYDNGSDHFDGNTTPHYHFICRECKGVSDLHMESIDHINVIANANFDGNIEGHVTYFHGICPSCKSKTDQIN